jgi:hypothetical protein
MPTVEAKCPECGFRVEVSESEQRMIDPASRCKRKESPITACPNLRAACSKARAEVNRPHKTT